MGVKYDMHTIPEIIFINMLLHCSSIREWDCRRMGAKESDSTVMNKKKNSK